MGINDNKTHLTIIVDKRYIIEVDGRDVNFETEYEQPPFFIDAGEQWHGRKLFNINGEYDKVVIIDLEKVGGESL